MKKRLIAICLLLLLVIVSGCEKKTPKTMKCTRKEPFEDTQIDWKNELELKFDLDENLDKASIKHVITLDPSVTETRKKEFKESIYRECSDEPGNKFNLCDVKEENNVYTVKLETDNLVLLDSAISTNNEQSIEVNSNIEKIKTVLEEKNYKCEVE
jgi:hypothetical protein